MSAVRSSVGGELLVIEPDGRVSERRPIGETGLRLVVPSVSPVTTLFVRYGDLGGLAGLVLLLGLSFPSLIGRSPPGAPDSGDPA